MGAQCTQSEAVCFPLVQSKPGWFRIRCERKNTNCGSWNSSYLLVVWWCAWFGRYWFEWGVAILLTLYLNRQFSTQHSLHRCTGYFAWLWNINYEPNWMECYPFNDSHLFVPFLHGSSQNTVFNCLSFILLWMNCLVCPSCFVSCRNYCWDYQG